MKGPWMLCTLAAVAALSSPRAAAQTVDLTLTNANVIDVNTGRIQTGATVVIAAGRIDAIVPAGAPIPASDREIDLGGRWVAPGLIDAHVHIASFEDARRALRSGVTTARSMGVPNYVDVGLRELARQGRVESPEILAAGYHVRPPAGEAFFLSHPELGRYRSGGIRGVEAVTAMTRAILSRGVDFVKTNATERAGLPETDPRKQFYSEAELRAIVAEAAEKGIGVAAHAHGDAGARAAVLAGVRSIEHGTYLSEQTLRLMRERGTFLVPTMAIVTDLTVPGGDYDVAALQLRGRHMVPRVREMVRSAHALGLKIVASTDTGYGSNSTVRVSHELIEFVDAGMTPLEALRAATLNAAELLGVDDHTGNLARGFDADLIVLERNPLDDIGVVQDVLMVINNGDVVVQRGDWPRPVS